MKTKLLAKLKNLFIRRVDDNRYYSAWYVHVYFDYSTRQRIVALIGLNIIIAIVFALQDNWCEVTRQRSWIDREVEKRFRNCEKAFQEWQRQEWLKAIKSNEHD